MNLSKLFEGEAMVASDTCDGVAIAGITCDSRAVQEGFLFAAFKGEALDGIRFAENALAKGAVALLCDKGADVPESVRDKLIVLEVENPRQVFARVAARFYGAQPKHMVAVTGTNGKTSVAHFCRQIWHHAGKKSASIGTIGAVDSDGKSYEVAGLTTPDAVGLHQVLSAMHANGVEYAAMEASSHGLSQYRQDGVKLQAAGFTSFSRDHLDYHKTEAEYFNAKARLFSELLPEAAVAVLNADIKEYAALKAIAKARGQKVASYGEKGEDYRILSLKPQDGMQRIEIDVKGNNHVIFSPLIGKFQAYNLLCALGLVVASGIEVKKAVDVLFKVQAVSGRMECVGTHRVASIYIDYAHTPDGLEKALEELRPYTQGKLIVLFGCGGDRDKGKRPQMGEIASKLADVVLVTDDNPRTEDAATIRSEIMSACGANAQEISGRKEAIKNAVAMLDSGDVLLLAGKGHEDYQIIGTQKHPFDEKAIINEFIERKTMTKPLWNSVELEKATGVALSKSVQANGVSIDSRTLQKDDIFVAIKGEQFDGHAYVAQCLQKGAALAVVSDEIVDAPEGAPLLKVKDTLEGLVEMVRYRRSQVRAKVLAVTGSVGKTSTKGMMAHALAACGKTHSTAGNFNNHIGLPLTLARMPQDVDYAVIEMGMNHPGELAPLAELTKPHVAVVTTVESVHLEHFENEEGIAHEKAQIFSAMEKGGVAVLNRDNRHYAFMKKLVDGFGVSDVVTFGKHQQADVRLLAYKENDAHQAKVKASLHGKEIEFTLGITGEHQAMNALGVLASIHAAGVDVEKAAKALATYSDADGRGKVLALPVSAGECYIIDDSYNASPASVGAGILNLVNYAKRIKAGRTIAVLGDMFELGDTASELHSGLSKNIVENGVDLVFTAGDLMKNLYDKLPDNKKGGHYKDAPETAIALKASLKAGDVVLVKGSHGMQMNKIVAALKG